MGPGMIDWMLNGAMKGLFDANGACRPEMESDCEIPQSIASITGESTQLSHGIRDTNSNIQFDGSTYKAIEVTIDDSSIFAPSADNVQIGFRRAELQPTTNTGSDPATTGIKTLHFSVRADTTRPLNYTHEYQLAFLESADYSTNQFALKTGSIIDDSDPRGHLKKNWLRLVGNVNNDNGGKTLFEIPFGKDWHNFGLKLDFTKKYVWLTHDFDGKD